MIAQPERLRERIEGPRAWRRDTVDPRDLRVVPLPGPCRDDLLAFLEEWADDPRTPWELVIPEERRRRWAAHLKPVADDLEHGRGFALLGHVPVGEISMRDAVRMYWLIGRAIGRPIPQNVQGTQLYDVRDTGQSVAYGARFSVTNAESTFHTDNSFGETILDVVGLLCLKTAKDGGLSQIVSGYAVHDEMLARHSEELEVLYQPFHVDRRGGVREGETPTVDRPVVTWDGRELSYRYLRYWIEEGHRKTGCPLTRAQTHALDTFDAVLARPDLRLEFALEPGQIQFINNRWVLHNRTGFEDHEEPERKRHLVRLWLRTNDGPPRL